MATSTIKAPITNFVVVVETGTTSATIVSKLATLKTAFASLSTNEKHKSFLKAGNTIYQTFNVGGIAFVSCIVQSDRIVADIIVLGNSAQSMYEYTFKTSGTTIENLTNNTSTSNYQLCHWI